MQVVSAACMLGPPPSWGKASSDFMASIVPRRSCVLERCGDCAKRDKTTLVHPCLIYIWRAFGLCYVELHTCGHPIA